MSQPPALPPTLPLTAFAALTAAPPRSAGLVVAAILCYIGAITSLGWIGLQINNYQVNELLAGFSGARIPFEVLMLENLAAGLALAGLLIVAGVMLLKRAWSAIHVTAAIAAIVLVGGGGATVAEAMRRFADASPTAQPVEEHVVEVAIRTAACVVVPLAVLLLISRRPALGAIVAAHGSMPKKPLLLFMTGIALVWLALATTSLGAQAVPVGIHFGRFYQGSALTLWRVGFAAAWAIAGILMLGRRAMLGWSLAILTTLAAIASDAMLAHLGGSGALSREAPPAGLHALRATIAFAAEPDAPWHAFLYRAATPLAMLLLLLLAAQHFLFVEDPEPTGDPADPTGESSDWKWSPTGKSTRWD